MKFLVLGSSGMAGHIISIYLQERGHQVQGFSRREMSFVPTITGDVRNLEQLEQVITQGEYDAVINAVGILNQSAEQDPESAVFVNSYLPHFLAKCTRDSKTKVIQMSTDCVFAGNHAPYTEDSLYDGETMYDRSKALGELRDGKNLTLRNSIVGPDINEKGIGLLNWFMKQEGEIKGYRHAMWTGLTTLELAKVMEAAAEQDAVGLINMVHKENISKYDLLQLFNKYLRSGSVQIQPYDDFVLDKTLVRTNFQFAYTVPDYETMVAEMAQWMRAHRELYPHYAI